MVKGGSSSQAATLVPRAPTTTGTASARAPPTAAGMRKRTSKPDRRFYLHPLP